MLLIEKIFDLLKLIDYLDQMLWDKTSKNNHLLKNPYHIRNVVLLEKVSCNNHDYYTS